MTTKPRVYAGAFREELPGNIIVREVACMDGLNFYLVTLHLEDQALETSSVTWRGVAALLGTGARVANQVRKSVIGHYFVEVVVKPHLSLSSDEGQTWGVASTNTYPAVPLVGIEAAYRAELALFELATRSYSSAETAILASVECLRAWDATRRLSACGDPQ
jgi:hypothetical protein